MKAEAESENGEDACIHDAADWKKFPVGWLANVPGQRGRGEFATPVFFSLAVS